MYLIIDIQLWDAISMHQYTVFCFKQTKNVPKWRISSQIVFNRLTLRIKILEDLNLVRECKLSCKLSIPSCIVWMTVSIKIEHKCKERGAKLFLTLYIKHPVWNSLLVTIGLLRTFLLTNVYEDMSIPSEFITHTHDSFRDNINLSKIESCLASHK